MADIIEFPGFDPEPDLTDYEWEELVALLSRVRAQLDQLNETEPEDMECDEYEDWADRHEELEDLEDDILEHMDLMGG